jgi:hypothetical protein
MVTGVLPALALGQQAAELVDVELAVLDRKVDGRPEGRKEEKKNT